MPTDQALRTFQKAETAYNRGLIDLAIREYQKTVEHDPYFTGALINLGAALRDAGETEKALGIFRRAVAASPGEMIAQMNLATLLHDSGKEEESLAVCELVLRNADGEALLQTSALFTMGNVLENAGKLKVAMRCYENALAIMPGYTRIWNNVGAILVTQGRYREAIECFDKTLAAERNHYEAHVNRALVNMTLGNLLEGMKELEWRLVMPTSDVGREMKTLRIPRWRGESLKGKTILVHCEQGLGDTVFSARYLAQLEQRGAQVIFRCQKELLRLFTMSLIDVEVVAWDAPVPKANFQVSLLSIPAITEETGLPHSGTYISVDERLIEEWKVKLGPWEKPRVAVVWKGNPKFKHERQRGLDIDFFAPIFRDDRFECVSVQKGIASYDVARYQTVRNLSPEIRDFADTAAILMNVDVLVSMDTSVAHVAGAMGVAVNLLVPIFPEWRLNGTPLTSQWYAGTRFFRQTLYGDWTAPISRVLESLGRLLPHYSEV